MSFRYDKIALILATLGLFVGLDAIYLPAKAVLAQQLLDRAWQATLLTGKPAKPWPWADTQSLGRIIFPEQAKDYVILAGSMGRTLAFAPGHLTGSAIPGTEGHVVISAHRDSHFSILEELTVGDVIELETIKHGVRRYKIHSRQVVDSRYEPLIIDSTQHQLSLITCYPFNAVEAGGPLRLRFDAIPEYDHQRKY